MFKYGILIALAFVSITSAAQTDLTTRPRSTFSFGTPSVVFLGSNLSDDPGYASFLTFGYKLRNVDRQFRLDVSALTGDSNKSSEEYVIGLGQQYDWLNPKKLALNWGWSATYYFQKAKDETNQKTHIGIGPIIGFNYIFNDHIMLLTEMQISGGWYRRQNFINDSEAWSFGILTHRFISLELGISF